MPQPENNGVTKLRAADRPIQAVLSESEQLQKGQRESQLLNYASEKAPAAQGRLGAMSGKMAFVFAVLQVPWYCLMGIIGMGMIPQQRAFNPTPPRPSAFETIAWHIAFIIPSLLGFASGCYSLKVGTIRGFGVFEYAGTLICAAVIILTALDVPVFVWALNSVVFIMKHLS